MLPKKDKDATIKKDGSKNATKSATIIVNDATINATKNKKVRLNVLISEFTKEWIFEAAEINHQSMTKFIDNISGDYADFTKMLLDKDKKIESLNSKVEELNALLEMLKE